MVSWAVLLVALPALAAAVEKSNIEVKNQAFQEVEVVSAQGVKELRQVPAEKVMPGTDVIYVTTVKNVGPKPAENIIIDNPVPAHMQFRTETPDMKAAQVEVSVDGGQQFGPLSALQVTDGPGRKRPAQGKDVTHVRFKVAQPLPPGDVSQFHFRATLQ